jgi:hypothetical protein
MSIKQLISTAFLGGLLLPLAASAGVVKTITSAPGQTAQVAGTLVWCEGKASDWKPSGPPKYTSGTKVSV